MTRWLYRFEAKGIQGYVLGTSRLREIAGASDLVEALADDVDKWRRCFGGKVHVNAAGGATLEFDDAGLRAFASGWPYFCALTRPGLQIIQAWVEHDRPEALEVLYARLGADRMAPTATLPEVGPLVERAARTGQAAVARRKDLGLLDEPTRAKVEAESRHSLEHRLLHGSLAGARFERSNDRLSERYVAVVHADGNGIGALFRQTSLDGRHSKKLASEALRTATAAATHEALEFVARAWPRDPLPCRPVVLGGDDLTLLLPAEDALPFTVRFLTSFARHLREAHGAGRIPCEATASAGIAMVKGSFPYNAAYDLAEQLCQHAKRRSKAEGGVATLAFHRVTTASVRDWDDILAHELRQGTLGGHVWTLEELGSLERLAYLVAHRSVPRGTLREWLRVKQGDPARAGAIYRRFIDVIRQDREDGAELAKELDGHEKARGDAWSAAIADALAWAAIIPPGAPLARGPRLEVQA